MTIPFHPSQRSTLGVEWELALVDADSGDLRQVAQTILDTLSPDGSEHPTIRQELLLNTVEVVSKVCHTTGEAIADLTESVGLLRSLTNPLRVDLMCAGTHPFAHWGSQKVSNKARYATLIDRTQFWGRQMLIYGVHVHVGIEDRAKVFPLIGALLAYYPHLLALSASSPFWDGRDTGYASNRALLFQQLPTAGLPYTTVDSWEMFERYVGDMRHTGVIDSVDEVRWDIRPSPHFGTIELRVFDGISNVGELASIVALAHCLVEHLSRKIDAGEPLPSISPWFLSENKWRAARYGMDAIIILDQGGEEEPVADALEGLVAELMPVASDLGCTSELAGVREIIRLGASYQRQRQAFELGGFEAVVAHLVREFKEDRPLPTQEGASP